MKKTSNKKSLRDDFAMSAMVCCIPLLKNITESNYSQPRSRLGEYAYDMAKFSYTIADAMLKAREVENAGKN